MFNSSGIGTYLRNLVCLVLQAYPDINFNLIGRVQELEYLKAYGKNIKIIDCSSPIYSISEQFEVFKKIPKNTTLFWSPHYNIPLLYGGKMLVTVYDLFHLAMPELVGGIHKRIYAKLMFKAVRLKAAAILTISDFTKMELVRFTGEGPQKIYPIHLGVADFWFETEKSASPCNKKFLLYVGNVKPHKNLKNLVRAFGLLVDKIPHDLIIVGKKEGFITGDPSLLLEAANVGERVKFTGYVDDKVLKQYFSHADAFIFPSLYEGFGLPPLEAMAAGCPVIVSNTASLPEICADAAIYCDPLSYEDIAEKILKIVSDIQLREVYRRKGIEHSRKFTWEKCAIKTCKVITKLLLSCYT